MLTREQLDVIYEKAIMNDDHYASQEVKDADSAHDDALMAYIVAIQKDTFIWAYELGFKAGQEACA